ncbi:MAG: sensor histidine kinase [Desulfitobacteriaceae bacterium]
MTLKRKFLIALISMVVFMSLVFAVISLTSLNFLLGHAVNYVQQGFNQQWNSLLSSYYTEHRSWDGVQNYVLRLMEDSNRRELTVERDSDRLYVFDAQRKVVASSRSSDVGKSLAELPQASRLSGHLSEVKNGEQTVGYFWLDDKLVVRQSKLARSVGRTIINSLIIGLVLTTILALILGIILTSRFTGPLRNLTEAVKKVGKGDLTTRLKIKGKDDIAMLSHAFNQMTEQLARNEEVRRNMVADIAHELRTPLAVIYGKLESLQDGVLVMSPETLLPIQDETIRLTRLVQDLQQLSLAEAGKLPLHLFTVDITSLLGKILEQFAIEFETRQIEETFVTASPDQTYTVEADADRLTQVFVNLIGNALLHTPPGGRLTVSVRTETALALPGIKPRPGVNVRDILTRRSGKKNLGQDRTDKEFGLTRADNKEWVKVSIQDTGVGIPEEERAHIFDRFYRVDRARGRETGGTGLGLAIAKEFVQAHQGRIEVVSKFGEGACFTVYLPVNQTGNTAAASY